MRNIHMKASIIWASSVLAGLGLAVAGAPALAAGTKNTNSEKVAKLLQPAQEMLKAKNYTGALAKIHEAAALPDKTPFDQFTIDEFGCNANAGAGNWAEAAKVCEAKLNDTGFMPDAEVPSLVKTLQAINYQLKNYDKAIEFGQRAIKGGYATDETKTILGQSKGDWKDTLTTENPQVDAEIKAGQTPKEQQLGLILNSCIKLDDEACQAKALEKYVTYYPKPEYWTFLLQRVRGGTTGGDAVKLQVYRLMIDTDTLKDAGDYNEAAQLALDAGSPGEAQKTLEKGFASNVFSDQRSKDRNTRLLESVKKSAATDQASLPKQEKDADAAPTGAKNVSVGLAYYGYGQNDKAIDEIQKGITKGGLKNEADAHLLLGIVQLKAGHKDDAVKSFKAVKGDATLERLATLWTLRARQA
jgi:tetratricopeptide (TPR) repeat protein